jgi:hypothetical protein
MQGISNYKIGCEGGVIEHCMHVVPVQGGEGGWFGFVRGYQIRIEGGIRLAPVGSSSAIGGGKMRGG